MKTLKNVEDTNTFKLYEENGVNYLYDRCELKKVFEEVRAKKGLTEDSMRWLIYEKTEVPAETILNHLRPPGKRGSSNPDSIETVKKYGKVLMGDEYALLKSMPLNRSEPSEKLHNDTVKAVFGTLYDILAQYEASDCFNCIPGTNDTDGAWVHFEGLIEGVRKKLTTDFLGKRDSEEHRKLERIIDETEIFIKSYSVPGVVERWQMINPQIKFFDCVFDLIDELGMETAQALNRAGRLAFFPGEYDIKARDMYFAEKAVRNIEGNLRYTETRIFQNELLLTLAMVFEKEFGSEDNSRVT